MIGAVIGVLKLIGATLLGVAVLLAAIWVANASWWSDYDPPPTVLAHRGLAQTFTLDGVTNDTCTASRIHEPEHGYLENTLPGIRAAFEAGADIVEFDVHPTTDGQFAVFHDWTLDCRTNGSGVTREHSMAELKALDVGFGYTADGGATYPFRGKGEGLTPSLDEVLDAFPDRRFLIHVKSNDRTEGEALAARLARASQADLSRLMVYGGDRPTSVIAARLMDVPVMGRTQMVGCLKDYMLTGWFGRTPATCRNTIILVPSNVGPALWGWPNRFVERMHKAGTEVFVAGAYAPGDPGSRGVDDPAAARRYARGYSGGVWTNRADLVAPVIRGGRARGEGS
ncbi:glycerophosphodiester phosphodiesterase [bacterium]|nr:glycerophosphodiester phosphodiesterase [bacterium]